MNLYKSLSISLALLMAAPAPAFCRDHFSLGADISGTTQLEADGIYSCNKLGKRTEVTQLMKDLGLDAVRLRVWVNPREGFSSPADVLTMALRAKDLGMDVMIDFHYSDWWADPGKQNPPAAWAEMDYPQMCDALYDHTRSTLKLLKDNGVDVKWVQVGNETTDGMLWPTGRASDNMEQYAGLTIAGYEAAKSVYPDTKVIVHLDNGYDRELYRNMFDSLKELDVKWDEIGMSVYPYWSKRDPLDETSVSDIIDNITWLKDRYGTDVMIVETGVEAAKPETGKKFLSRLLSAAIDTPACTGVFYWAPETSDGPYPLGAFHNNRPTVIMDAYTEAAAKLAKSKIY